MVRDTPGYWLKSEMHGNWLTKKGEVLVFVAPFQIYVTGEREPAE